MRSNWCNDLTSLAHKVSNEQKIDNMKLLRITEDVRKFNTHTSDLADKVHQKLLRKNKHLDTFSQRKR